MVYSNCWIALGAAASCLQFYFLTDTEIHYPLLAFIFSGTLLTYTFQRYVKLNSGIYNQSARMIWMKKRPKLVQAIMLTAVIASLFIVVSFPPEAFVFLIVMGTISYFYIQKLPGKNNRNLRDRPFIKIYLIAGVWALTSVLLPMFLLENFHWNHLWLALVNFLFVLAITIPFDIRDIELDEEDKFTIPQLMGVRNSKILAVFFAASSFALLLYLYPDMWPPIGGTALFTIALVVGSARKRPDQYYSFFVDGLLILQAALIGLFDWLSIYETVTHP